MSKKHHMVKFNLMLPMKLLVQVEKMAHIEGESVASLIRRAMMRYIVSAERMPEKVGK